MCVCVRLYLHDHVFGGCFLCVICVCTHNVVCEHVFQKYRIKSLFVLGTPSGFDTNIISV